MTFSNISCRRNSEELGFLFVGRQINHEQEKRTEKIETE